LINEYGIDMNDKTLFEPYTLGSLTLSNRIVMAPLTRNRAGAGFVPSELAATYYSQRASAGLMKSGRHSSRKHSRQRAATRWLS
jgi:N-ethylmaleimide reductase